MPLTQDPHLLDICSDVVVRFKGHGSYGEEEKALKALGRRTHGSSPEECRAVFDVLCRVYDRAVEGIKHHPTIRPQKKGRYSEFEDIDFDACMKELEEIAPGEALKQKREILTWVIYWHYLR